jgi:hypothetical protein
MNGDCQDCIVRRMLSFSWTTSITHCRPQHPLADKSAAEHNRLIRRTRDILAVKRTPNLAAGNQDTVCRLLVQVSGKHNATFIRRSDTAEENSIHVHSDKETSATSQLAADLNATWKHCQMLTFFGKVICSHADGLCWLTAQLCPAQSVGPFPAFLAHRHASPAQNYHTPFEHFAHHLGPTRKICWWTLGDSVSAEIPLQQHNTAREPTAAATLCLLQTTWVCYQHNT